MLSRKRTFEVLEKRLPLTATWGAALADYVDVSELEIEPTYTTFDSPANHETAVGTGFDGVVRLDIQTTTGNFLGSGTLLPTGRHILTAAHNLTNADPNTPPLVVTSLNAVFELPGGDVTVSSNVFAVPSSWNRVLTNGSDLAIVELIAAAPADAERYDIFRGSSEIGSVGEKVGYGQSGQGVASLAAGTKRDGSNLYELFFDSDEADILLFDFDNGTSGNDTFGVITNGALANTGLGNAEVLNAPGDSGGPTFIGNEVAGVTSFVTRTNSGVGDVDSTLNFSFGEIGADTRVSAFAPFIDSIIDVAGLPQVANVTISGSTSTHAPHVFNDPNDDINDFDGSGIQLKRVPVGGADTVAIEFSEHVLNIDSSSLILKELAIGHVPQLAAGGFVYDVGTHTATWTFDAPFDADHHYLSLSDTVTDVGGNQLDGEWTNPFSVTTTDSSVSTFPSGNGTAGGDFNFVFTILPGDADGDNDVDGSDFFSYTFNQGGPDHTFQQADFNGDGFTDPDDLALWQANYGSNPIYGANLRDLAFSDYNADGIVSMADYWIWSDNYGTSGQYGDGDGNGDGDINGNDFILLYRQFGLELDWVS